jgi:hypothetical protein
VAEVRLTLHDGETLTIADEAVWGVYENLWRLSDKPGAITVAGALIAASRQSLPALDLDGPQSAVIREAIAMLETG